MNPTQIDVLQETVNSQDQITSISATADSAVAAIWQFLKKLSITSVFGLDSQVTPIFQLNPIRVTASSLMLVIDVT